MHNSNPNALPGNKAAKFPAEHHRLPIGEPWLNSQSQETFALAATAARPTAPERGKVASL